MKREPSAGVILDITMTSNHSLYDLRFFSQIMRKILRPETMLCASLWTVYVNAVALDTIKSQVEDRL